MTAGLVLVLALMPTDLNGLAPDTPVAHVGDRIVRYREIGCTLGTVDESAAKARNSTVEELCLRAEENEIYRIIGLELTKAAVEKHHLELTAGEAADAVPPKYRDENLIRQMTESNRVQARAALRVLRGEDRQRVFEDELSDRALAAKGLTEIHFMNSSIDSLLQMFPTVADAERQLASFTDQKTKRRLTETFRQEAIGKKIGELIRERASARGIPFEDAKQEFWIAMAREVKVEILSPRYQSPPFLRGVK